MGIKGGKNGHNMGFGNLCNLKPVINTEYSNPNRAPKTRIIRISEQMYSRFVAHSQKFYNVESYETILSDLLDCYQKQNTPDYSSSRFHSNK